MMALNWLSLLLPTLALLSFTQGQLIGPVGPTTPLAHKLIECNILNYGAKADNRRDVAPAIHAAYKQCVLPNPGSRLIVPSGTYLTTENIVLANATNWAFQLDGLITAYVTGIRDVAKERLTLY
jgi:rhamnogalacturonan hydrolase